MMQFNESRAYSKSIQKIVTTNIKQQLTPPPLSIIVLKDRWILATITKQGTQTPHPFEISKLIHTLPKKNSPH